MTIVKPEISVVLPVYNGELYIEDAISSILSQSFTNFELIIVNDYSTDNTSTLIEGFKNEDKRIKVINNSSNKKLPTSLNIGFSIAKGDFYTWTSDDNTMNEKMLETLLKTIKKYNVDIVYSNYDRIDDDGKRIGYTELHDLAYILFNNPIGASFLYTKSVHNELGGYDDKKFLVEDYDFWVRAFVEKMTFFHIPKSLYNYRVHSNALSAQNPKKIFFGRKKIIEYQLSALDIKNFSTIAKSLILNDVPPKEYHKYLLQILHKNNKNQIYNADELLKQFRKQWLIYLSRSPQISLLHLVDVLIINSEVNVYPFRAISSVWSNIKHRYLN